MQQLFSLFIIGFATDFTYSYWIMNIAKGNVWRAVFWTIVTGVLSCCFIKELINLWSFYAVSSYVGGLAIGTYFSVGWQKFGSLKKIKKRGGGSWLSLLKTASFSNKEEFTTELAQILYFETMAKKCKVRLYSLGDKLSDEIWDNLDDKIKSKYLKIAEKKCEKDIKLKKFLTNIK